MSRALRLGTLLHIVSPIIVAGVVLSGLAHPSFEGSAEGCSGGTQNASGSKLYYLELHHAAEGIPATVAGNAPVLLVAVHHGLSPDEVLAHSQVEVRDEQGALVAGTIERAGRVENPSKLLLGAEAALMLWRPSAPLTPGATYTLKPSMGQVAQDSFKVASEQAGTSTLAIDQVTLWAGKTLDGPITSCKGAGGCNGGATYPFASQEVVGRWLSVAYSFTSGSTTATMPTAVVVASDLGTDGDPLLIIPEAGSQSLRVNLKTDATPACTPLEMRDLVDASKTTTTSACSDETVKTSKDSPLKAQLASCDTPPEDASLLDDWCSSHAKFGSIYEMSCQQGGAGAGGAAGSGQAGQGQAGSGQAGQGQAGGGQAGGAGAGQQAEAPSQVMPDDNGCSTAGAGRGKAGLGALAAVMAAAALGRRRRP